MVRVYDPERTDPTVKFLKGLSSFYEYAINGLSNEEIQSALKVFLKDKQYLNMFKKYHELEADFPEIIIKNDCKKGQYYLNPVDYPNRFFKSNYNPVKNEIVLCSNLMFNVLDFKENLDRELIMAYDQNILKKNIASNDEDFACSQIRACHAEIYNYSNYFDKKTQNQMSNICSRFLIKHKGPNSQQMPTDIWVRYAEKLNEKYQYCINLKEPFDEYLKQ